MAGKVTGTLNELKLEGTTEGDQAADHRLAPRRQRVGQVWRAGCRATRSQARLNSRNDEFNWKARREKASAGATEDARLRAQGVPSRLLRRHPAGAAHQSGRHDQDDDGGCGRPRCERSAAIDGRQSGDRAVLCRGRDARRHAGHQVSAASGSIAIPRAAADRIVPSAVTARLFPERQVRRQIQQRMEARPGGRRRHRWRSPRSG